MQEQATLETIITELLRDPINDTNDLMKDANKIEPLDKAIVGSFLEGCIVTIKALTQMTDEEINYIIESNLNSSLEKIAEFYVVGSGLDD